MWWEQEHVPTEAQQARVALLFKKGDTAKWANYRPIALLPTTYKLFTAIQQRRISDKLDPYLQQTQYGFRQHKATTDAIHYIRRAIEEKESSGIKTFFILLDWEKAFDKV
jgi:hypothetical protein